MWPHSRLDVPLCRSLRRVMGLVLISIGMVTNAMDAPLDARKYFQDPRVAQMVEDIQTGREERVRAALSQGVSANAEGLDGLRPIHFVFSARSAKVAEVLLAAGADPNLPGAFGNTPLHYAVQQPTVDFTEVLLRYRADPAKPGAANKPVLNVALSSPVAAEILPMLKKAGANIDLLWGGYSPVQAAMVQQDWVSVVTLLQLGANPDIKSAQGETAAATFCRLLGRMRPGGVTATHIRKAGDLLGKERLSAECQGRLSAFL